LWDRRIPIFDLPLEAPQGDDLHTIFTGVGHFSAGEDNQMIGFADGNLFLGKVVFPDEADHLCEMGSPVFDFPTPPFSNPTNSNSKSSIRPSRTFARTSSTVMARSRSNSTGLCCAVFLCATQKKATLCLCHKMFGTDNDRFFLATRTGQINRLCRAEKMR